LTRFGYSLMCEEHHPNALLERGRRAEELGFDFLTVSDHFHPWLYSQRHSPYAWSLLGGLAATTERVDLVSFVTCPIIRYHPAIVAQKAATVAAMSGGRLVLGLGSGENLNEHVVGRGWPPVTVRHEMLEEAIGIIRELWTGKMVFHEGRHFTVHDARIHTRPDEPPEVAVAVSGDRSVALAAEHADAMIAGEPDAGLTGAWESAAGGGGPRYGQLAVCVHPDEAEARRIAHERFRFTVPGWKVMAELPNPINFEAATEPVREEDVAERIPCGPDPGPVRELVRRWVDAGFDHVAIVPVGDDPEPFLQMWEQELRPQLAPA
jgi:G6PDH family F420-dependent oxidoreductase